MDFDLYVSITLKILKEILDCCMNSSMVLHQVKAGKPKLCLTNLLDPKVDYTKMVNGGTTYWIPPSPHA